MRYTNPRLLYFTLLQRQHNTLIRTVRRQRDNDGNYSY